MANRNTRIAKNTAYLYVRLILVMFVTLFSVRVIMHELGEEGYGTFNVVAGFVTMLGFIGTSMTPGIQRFFNYEMGLRGEEAANDVLSAALKIQLSVSFVVILLFETIGLWYVNNIMNLPNDRITEINYLYQFAILSLVMNIVVVPYSAFVIAKEHMNCYAMISILDAIAKLGIAYAIGLFSSNRLAIYGLLLLLIAIFNFFAYFIYSKKLFPWLKFKMYSCGDLIRPILTFSGWNLLNTATNIGKGQGVNLLLNYYFGVAINAANAIVVQIYSAVQMFSLNICTAFKPQIVEAYAKRDFQKTLSMFYVLSKCAYALVFIIFVPLVLQLQFILHLWIGDVVPAYTSEFTIITLFSVLVGSLNTPITIVIFANGNIKSYTLIYSGIMLTIPLGWIAFNFGAPATVVFWITLILMILIQIASMIILKKYLSYSYKKYFREVLLPLARFSIMAPILPAMISFSEFSNEIVKFLTVGSISVICSLTCAYFLLLDKGQRNFVMSRIAEIKKKRI